ncbi:MAG: AraC family transcriptional regulator [Sphingobacteriales bacterium]|nr:MAG: AraC family transcriptional regulator [Sphingobacteriales bacterium]
MKNYRKYITSGQSDQRWYFDISTVGSASVKPNKDYPNNKAHPIDHSFTWDKGRILNGYYIIFVTRGEGILETAKTRPFRIKAGHCFFLFPGVWHRYKPDVRIGWEEYWVGFRGDYPDMLMKNGIFNPENPFAEVGLNEEVLALFHSLIKTIQSGEPGYAQIAAGITLQVLGLIHALSKYHAVDEQSRIISKAKFILQETIDNPMRLEEVAKELPMGYSKFRQLFKDVCGISPNQYQLNLRLDKVNELLLTTNLSISEVAYQTGFDSIYYFSRLFKQRNGLSPKAYRDQRLI